MHVRDTDTYDQYLIPDKQTLEITDLATGDQLVTADPPMGVEGDYTAAWDDASHELTIAYSDKYVQEHWTKGSHPQVQVRFEGTVSEDAPTTVKVGNRWALTLNGSVTPSNIVENNPPKHDPSKKDTQSSAQGDPTVTIDGKTMLLGDTGNYTVTLDLKQKDNAYRVWRAGITDDYDEQYVSILPSDIEVLDQSGEDVTGRFNVQVRDASPTCTRRPWTRSCRRPAGPSRATRSPRTSPPTPPRAGTTRSTSRPSTRRCSARNTRSSCRTRSSRPRTATPSGTRPSRSPTTRRPRPTRCPTRSSRSTRPRT